MITLRVKGTNRRRSMGGEGWAVWALTLSYNKKTKTYTVIDQRDVNWGTYDQDFVGWDLKKLAAWTSCTNTKLYTAVRHEVLDTSEEWINFCTITTLRKILDEQRKVGSLL